MFIKKFYDEWTKHKKIYLIINFKHKINKSKNVIYKRIYILFLGIYHIILFIFFKIKKIYNYYFVFIFIKKEYKIYYCEY